MFQQIIDDLIGTPGGPEEQEQAASRLIETCGYAAAAATLIPLPGTELIAVTSIHVGMVIGLSQIYGIDMSKETATELMTRIGTTVGASFVSSRLATTIAKVALPGLGGLLGAPLMYATTLALGAVARTFLSREGNMTSQEMKDLYKQAVKNAKQQFDPAKARSQQAKDMATDASTTSDERPASADTSADTGADTSEEADLVARLKKLKGLFEADLLDAEEYEAERRRILDEI